MQQSTSPAKNGSPSHSQRQLRATRCAVSCITGLSGGVPRWHRSSRTWYVAVHGWPGSPPDPSVGASAGSASGDGNGGGGSPAARARAVSAANAAVFGKQAPFAHRPSGALSASSRAPHPSCSTRARSIPEPSPTPTSTLRKVAKRQDERRPLIAAIRALPRARLSASRASALVDKQIVGLLDASLIALDHDEDPGSRVLRGRGCHPCRMQPVHVWIRSESRGTERRAPVVPADVPLLLDAGFEVTVEESPQRIFAVDEYAAAGASVVGEGTWTDAPHDAYVLGIKELPDEPPSLRHRHIYFAHSFKGQDEAR